MVGQLGELKVISSVTDTSTLEHYCFIFTFKEANHSLNKQDKKGVFSDILALNSNFLVLKALDTQAPFCTLLGVFVFIISLHPANNSEGGKPGTHLFSRWLPGNYKNFTLCLELS